jgi:ribonucleoside-diphosphate reductase alpha chain
MLDKEKYFLSKYMKRLPAYLREDMLKHGIRNSHLLSIAPTGTMSLLAGNVSSGIEPIFSAVTNRRMRLSGSEEPTEVKLVDYACYLYKQMHGQDALPPNLVTAQDLSVKEHVEIMSIFQKYVDASISKTINIPEKYDFESFKQVYIDAWKNGLKGCTTFRPNSNLNAVLVAVPENKKEEKKEEKKQDKPHKQEHGVTPRPAQLNGTTYKIKDSFRNALYITVNDTVEEDGHKRPYEVFVSALQNNASMTAITRLLSAVFRRERDPRFIINELKEIQDPNGGYIADRKSMPSVIAHIGHVLDKHVTGLLKAGEFKHKEGEQVVITEGTSSKAEDAGSFAVCPKCSHKALVMESGCCHCNHCDYSRCG